MQEALEKIFVIHGKPIRKNTDDDFEFDIYTKALKYIENEIIKHTVFKNSDTNIQIFVVNNFEINAHAIKLDQNEYVIILKSGLIDFAMQTCGFDIDFLKEELRPLGDHNDIMGLYIYFTLMYFSGHEFGHIINGHLEFSKNTQMLDEKSKINILNINSIPNELKANPNVFQHLLELNADKLSTVFLVRGLLNLYIKYKQTYDKDVLESLIKLVVYNIYLTHYKFGFFNVKNDNYPTHFFRAYSIFHNFPEMLNTLLKSETHKRVETTVHDAVYKIFDYLSDRDEAFLHDNDKKDIFSYNENMSNLYTEEHKAFNDFLKSYIMV